MGNTRISKPCLAGIRLTGFSLFPPLPPPSLCGISISEYLRRRMSLLQVVLIIVRRSGGVKYSAGRDIPELFGFRYSKALHRPGRDLPRRDLKKMQYPYIAPQNAFMYPLHTLSANSPRELLFQLALRN